MSQPEQMKPLDDADDPDRQNNQRQPPAHAGNEIMRKLPADSVIEFSVEIFTAPAEAVGAEDCQVERPQRQEIVADNEIFKVQHA